MPARTSNQVLPWETIEAVVAGARLSLLYGPPGTGKTTAANRAGSPDVVYNVTLSDETPAAELRGHFVPAGTEWTWMDGPAMRAFKEGARLVLNEVDKASADALDFLHGLLDDPGVAAVTLPTGATVRPAPGFTVCATMNGDLADLPDALRDRFSVAVECLDVHPAAVAALPADLQTVAAVPDSAGSSDRPGSLRAWRCFADLRETVGVETAAAAVFAHRADEVLAAFRLAGSR